MKKITIAILMVLGISGIALAAYSLLSKPKHAYVQLGKVYSEFTLTQELKANYDNQVNARQLYLDSLELEIRNLGAQIELLKQKDPVYQEKVNLYLSLREMYVQKEELFTENNELSSAKYSEQIWEQLNTYIKDFGDRESYTFIWGANGEGSLMYGNDEMNLTDEIINYVNDRYEGKSNE